VNSIVTLVISDFSFYSPTYPLYILSLSFLSLLDSVIGVHQDAIRCVEFSPSVNQVFTGSWDATVKGWDPRSKTCTGTHVQGDNVYTMALNEEKLVVGTAGRRVLVWDLRNMSSAIQKRESSLKYQTRCIKAFPSRQGYVLSSIEGEFDRFRLKTILKKGSLILVNIIQAVLLLNILIQALKFRRRNMLSNAIVSKKEKLSVATQSMLLGIILALYDVVISFTFKFFIFMPVFIMVSTHLLLEALMDTSMSGMDSTKKDFVNIAVILHRFHHFLSAQTVHF